MTDSLIDVLNEALDGRYEIQRELGQGGMATVHLARDLKHNRNVALKVLKPELAAVVGAERFLAEIETTANLQHPHILPLFDSGEAGGFVFYVMPYVEGETLRDRLDQEKQLPVDEAVRIGTNVAEALDYAHAQGVVHRDIKPSNILLQAGKPVIADFGIALAVGAAGGGRLTETGLSLGTPHYMSPEQATGDRAVGAATDIYALGCVLYEMLVGDPPYVGSTAQAILGKIVTEDADPVTKHRRAVPPNVDGAIRRALERLPADRFRSAADLARALNEPGYRYGEAARATAGSGPWKRVALGLAVLAVASTGSLAWSLLRPEARRTPAHFVSPFEPGQEPLGPVEFTPDGSALVYVGPRVDGAGEPVAAVDNRQLWIRRLDEPVARPIDGTDGVHGGSYLEFAPDGRELAFAGKTPHGLWVVPVEGGPARLLAPSSLGAHGWTDDGFVYFQTITDRVIHRVAASGGGTPERVTETRDTETAHDALRFLPGGKVAVFTVYDAEGPAAATIWAMDMETGERRRLAQGVGPRFVSSGHLLYVRGDGTLMGAPIDGDGDMGDPVALIGGLAITNGVPAYAVSSQGALAYSTGTAGVEVQTSLVWVTRDGLEQPVGLDGARYDYPRISPEGDRVAVGIVGDDTDLWVVDFERLSRARLTYGGDNRYFPVWSPDGTRVVVSNRPTDGNAILSTAADGSGRIDTLLAREGAQFPTSWSRDGSVLAFYERSLAQPENGRDLWVWPLDGEPQPFLTTPYEERQGAFSPDGLWMAYAARKTGRDEVYLRPYPGPGAEVVVSTEGGTEPVWSRDGSELYFRTGGSMMVVDVGDPSRPGVPEPLWDDPYTRDPSSNAAPNYDVHPDGRFLMVKLDESSRGRVHVIMNWVEELKARVPR